MMRPDTDNELNYLRLEAAHRIRRISVFTFLFNSVSLSMCIIYIVWGLNIKRIPGTSSWEVYKYFVFHAFNLINLAAIIFSIMGQIKSNSKFIVAYIYANACFLVMAVFFLLSLFLMALQCANSTQEKTFHRCLGFGYYIMVIIIWNMLTTACIALEFAKLVRINREIRVECDRILTSKCPVGSQSEFSQSARRAMLNEMTAADFAEKIRNLDVGEDSVSSVRTIRSDEPLNSSTKRPLNPSRYAMARYNIESLRSLPANSNSLARERYEESAKSARPPLVAAELPLEIGSPVRIDCEKIDETDSPPNLSRPEAITNSSIVGGIASKTKSLDYQVFSVGRKSGSISKGKAFTNTMTVFTSHKSSVPKSQLMKFSKSPNIEKKTRSSSPLSPNSSPFLLHHAKTGPLVVRGHIREPLSSGYKSKTDPLGSPPSKERS